VPTCAQGVTLSHESVYFVSCSRCRRAGVSGNAPSGDHVHRRMGPPAFFQTLETASPAGLRDSDRGHNPLLVAGEVRHPPAADVRGHRDHTTGVPGDCLDAQAQAAHCRTPLAADGFSRLSLGGRRPRLRGLSSPARRAWKPAAGLGTCPLARVAHSFRIELQFLYLAAT